MWTLTAAAVAVIALFVCVSASLVSDLEDQERQRMQLWADATRRLAAADTDMGADIDFLLSVIETNTNIPVILADNAGNIILHRNFDLPEPMDSLAPLAISAANAEFLSHRLSKMKDAGHSIDIELAPGTVQHLYYEDSTLLNRLSGYPALQILVMLAFVAAVYLAVSASRKAEQNMVWVGLSKETAHQLGTPISSLMAWTQVLAARGVDPETVGEMDKDIERLASIASRFGKVGSRPALESGDFNAMVAKCCDYMRLRIPRATALATHLLAPPSSTPMCAPLLEWVMENLIKNSVDAIGGNGVITVTTLPTADPAIVAVEVADTGKGLPRKLFKDIFKPGFTTKKRGWGLGLALAKRIVADYHRGRIFVKSSEPGAGTVIRIELPTASPPPAV